MKGFVVQKQFMSETVVLGNTLTHFVECATASSAGRKKNEYLMKTEEKTYYYKWEGEESRLTQHVTIFINPNEDLSQKDVLCFNSV